MTIFVTMSRTIKAQNGNIKTTAVLQIPIKDANSIDFLCEFMFQLSKNARVFLLGLEVLLKFNHLLINTYVIVKQQACENFNEVQNISCKTSQCILDLYRRNKNIYIP